MYYNPDSEKIGYFYFPSDTGLTREYLVRKINYEAGNISDTSFWYYKEIQKDLEVNPEGDTLFNIFRYLRDSDSVDWAIDSVIRIKKNKWRIIATENNIPYVKFIFPVEDMKKWNGNAYNSLEKEEYHYEEVSLKSGVLDKEYPVTVKVIQKEFIDTIVYTLIKKEFYAANIGMIYREYVNLNYCTESEECIGKKQISSGVDFRQWLINYGDQ